MLGGILGREKKMETISTIQPFSLIWGWGYTNRHVWDKSALEKNQTLPCRSRLQGYKLVGQVQFMLLVIQKGG